MRRTILAAGLIAAVAASAAAQDRDPDPRLVIREQARDVIRNGRLVRVNEAPRAYQGRNQGPEQTERFSRKVKVGRDGRVSISNISGDIVVTTASGDEVSIEAVKRTRGDRSELAGVEILVESLPGRVEVRTEHERFRGRDRRGDSVSVDYTVSIPSTAGVELHSVSGTIKVTGARGAVRMETISGDVVAADTPKIEVAKSVSGNVTLSGVATDGDLAAASVSGNVQARSVKVHTLELNSVSGNVTANDVVCDRLTAKSISGGMEYSGSINKGGVYDINVHSGTVRLMLANPAGFVLNANSFSGSIRSDLPMTLGSSPDGPDADRRARRGLPGNRSMRATYGDGSATLNVRTFSGDIVIAKR